MNCWETALKIGENYKPKETENNGEDQELAMVTNWHFQDGSRNVHTTFKG